MEILDANEVVKQQEAQVGELIEKAAKNGENHIVVHFTITEELKKELEAKHYTIEPNKTIFGKINDHSPNATDGYKISW